MEGRAAGCWRTLWGRRGWNNQEGVPGLLGGCWRRGECGVTRGTGWGRGGLGVLEGRGSQGLEEGEPGAGACRGWARGPGLCCQPLPAHLSLRRPSRPWPPGTCCVRVLGGGADLPQSPRFPLPRGSELSGQWVMTGNVLRTPLDSRALRGLERKFPRGRALCAGPCPGIPHVVDGSPPRALPVFLLLLGQGFVLTWGKAPALEPALALTPRAPLGAQGVRLQRGDSRIYMAVIATCQAQRQFGQVSACSKPSKGTVPIGGSARHMQLLQ